MTSEQAIIRAHEKYIRQALKRAKRGKVISLTGLLASAEGLRQLKLRRRRRQ